MQPEFAAEAISHDARRLADWVIASGDAHGLPFLIIDKVEARIFAFDPFGRIRSAAPALLGLAKGDVSPPGIGTRKLMEILPAERITPAGRFEAGFGYNIAGKDILWIDYGGAVSLHRVVTANAAERRLERLATPSPYDNRVSYGCINVSPAFYEQIVRPLFAATDGIVYVMPEVEPLDAVFAINNPSGASAAPEKAMPLPR